MRATRLIITLIVLLLILAAAIFLSGKRAEAPVITPGATSSATAQ